jgi:hypothetical protein
MYHDLCRLLVFSEARMRRTILLIFTIGFAAAAAAQWTPPDTSEIPQPGPGAMAPWISNDNLHLFISSAAEISVFSRPSPDSAWGPRTDLPRHVNLMPTQQCPAVSPTGDTLYFVGDARTDVAENYGSWDIYFTIRNGECDTCWGAVHSAGPNVNSDRREQSVGISRDGGLLLVSSTRGGYAEAKLYWHGRQADGTWGPANVFPATINDLQSGEEHPSLSPDNQTLFFCHMYTMMGDVWYSHKIDGVWQQAVPMPSPPNDWPGLSRDEDPCMAADGHTMWYRHSFSTDYDYHIVVSRDTTLAADEIRSPKADPSSAVLMVAMDSSGGLLLEVTGVGLAGERKVRVHDILGRLATTVTVRFTSNGQAWVGHTRPPELAAGTYIISIQTSVGTLSARYFVTK